MPHPPAGRLEVVFMGAIVTPWQHDPQEAGPACTDP